MRMVEAQEGGAGPGSHRRSTTGRRSRSRTRSSRWTTSSALMERDIRLAQTELRYLREILRRELADIRSFIAQLRPPALDEVGMDGAIMEAVATFSTPRHRAHRHGPRRPRRRTQRDAADGRPPGPPGSVAEYPQACGRPRRRRHDPRGRRQLGARGPDDGRGFDVDAVAARGRRNFGLQFMRERVELIGGRLDVQSRPGAGTVVRLEIGREGRHGDGVQRARPAAGRAGPPRPRRAHADPRRGRPRLLPGRASGTSCPARPDFLVVGEADNARDAFDLAVELTPDIMLMDLIAAEVERHRDDAAHQARAARGGDHHPGRTRRTRTRCSTRSRPARRRSSSRTSARTTS